MLPPNTVRRAERPVVSHSRRVSAKSGSHASRRLSMSGKEGTRADRAMRGSYNSVASRRAVRPAAAARLVIFVFAGVFARGDAALKMTDARVAMRVAVRSVRADRVRPDDARDR